MLYLGTQLVTSRVHWVQLHHQLHQQLQCNTIPLLPLTLRILQYSPAPLDPGETRSGSWQVYRRNVSSVSDIYSEGHCSLVLRYVNLHIGVATRPRGGWAMCLVQIPDTANRSKWEEISACRPTIETKPCAPPSSQGDVQFTTQPHAAGSVGWRALVRNCQIGKYGRPVVGPKFT